MVLRFFFIVEMKEFFFPSVRFFWSITDLFIYLALAHESQTPFLYVDINITTLKISSQPTVCDNENYKSDVNHSNAKYVEMGTKGVYITDAWGSATKTAPLPPSFNHRGRTGSKSWKLLAMHQDDCLGIQRFLFTHRRSARWWENDYKLEVRRHNRHLRFGRSSQFPLTCIANPCTFHHKFIVFTCGSLCYKVKYSC